MALAADIPGETLDAIWSLVWRGLLTNDALHALRAYCAPVGHEAGEAGASQQQRGFRSRRTTPPTAQGRWSLNAAAFAEESGRRLRGVMRWRSSC